MVISNIWMNFSSQDVNKSSSLICGKSEYGTLAYANMLMLAFVSLDI